MLGDDSLKFYVKVLNLFPLYYFAVIVNITRLDWVGWLVDSHYDCLTLRQSHLFLYYMYEFVKKKISPKTDNNLCPVRIKINWTCTHMIFIEYGDDDDDEH